MTRYIIRRIIHMLPVLFGVSIVLFAMLHLGNVDPAVLILGPDAPQEAVEQLRSELGLDQPIPVQYGLWLKKVVTGDLGVSLRNRAPVIDILMQRLPATIELALLSFSFAFLLAVPLGAIAAIKRNSAIDTVVSSLSVFGLAVPNFWLGLMLILLFSLTLGWLPPSGFVPIWQDPLQNLRLMLLPSVTVGVVLLGVLTRMVRSSLLEVLDQDYVRTARAKGLAERLILSRHAMKNALIPVVTIAGLQIGRLLAGTVIAEQIFALPGLGRLVVESIFSRDYPVVQGAVLFMTFVVLFTNLLVDILYAWLDPRIAYS